MISPDTVSSGEMVSDALTRRQPVARGTSSNSIAIASTRRRRARDTRDPPRGITERLARTRSSCQTRCAIGVSGALQRQLAAQDRERPRVAGEMVATDDIVEAKPAVQPPRPVVLAADFRGGQQDVVLVAPGQQPAGQRLAQAAALCARMYVQLRQLEVAGHQPGDLPRGDPPPLQA